MQKTECSRVIGKATVMLELAANKMKETAKMGTLDMGNRMVKK